MAPEAHGALALLAFGGQEEETGALMLMMRWLFWHLVASGRKMEQALLDFALLKHLSTESLSNTTDIAKP